MMLQTLKNYDFDGFDKGDNDDHRGGSTPRRCEELEVPEEDQLF